MKWVREMYDSNGNTTGLPIKSWCDPIEDSAMEQVQNLAHLPFAFHHIAMMPDCHAGYGMPIGGVMATKGVVIPNAVGVDIGCGVYAVKTNQIELDTETLKKIMGQIRNVVPLGFNHHKEPQDEKWMPFHPHHNSITTVAAYEYQNARCSSGTLGGGNHFIEIQKGSDGHIWYMIHSGSRNLGKKVCEYYNKLAIEFNKKWYSQVCKEWQLAFLPMDSIDGQAYWEEMNYCLQFALLNRELISTRVTESFQEFVPQMKPVTVYDVHHNYCAIEHHFGLNVYVHRKGATRAYEGEIGIIPGSQGTKSYIVKGKGNIESFKSCSHGAGRTMSRTKAQATLNLEEEIKKMDAQGIVHGIRHQRDLDESAGAYKEISVVMDAQSDLVEKVVELTPMGVIKG